MLPDFSKGHIRFLMDEDSFDDDSVRSLSQLGLRMNCGRYCWFRDQLEGNSKGA